jgi:hypothetical protein
VPLPGPGHGASIPCVTARTRCFSKGGSSITSLGTTSLHRLSALFVAAVVSTPLALPVDGADAATQIGQTFQPTNTCSPRTRLQTGSPNAQYAAPSAGVITSWSLQSSSAAGESPVKLKAARAAGGDNFTIVGESEFRLIPDADQLNTFPVRIPVLAGDVIGLSTQPASIFLCSRTAAGYTVGESPFAEDTALGATSTFTPVPSLQLGVSAVLEPDCDSDGFGDETQDTDSKSCKDQSFSFGKLKRNKKRGTAKLTVTVPGPGTLALAGTGVVKQRQGFARDRLGAAAKVVSSAGAVKLKIKPRGNKKSRLETAGKVKLKAKITYTPAGGLPNLKTKRIRLAKKLD